MSTPPPRPLVRKLAGYGGFPDGFFDRSDESNDELFYGPIRLVQHIDDGAIAAVGELYQELDIAGRVLDLMGSWVSHFVDEPADLTVLGMNWTELQSNPMATNVLAHDLNADPTLAFSDNHFDHVVCAVSVDYLVQPLEVFAEVRRVLKPGGRFVCTFSNRFFPTKAIRGWLVATEAQRTEIVASYFGLTRGFGPVIVDQRPTTMDPLWAVHATKLDPQLRVLGPQHLHSGHGND